MSVHANNKIRLTLDLKFWSDILYKFLLAILLKKSKSTTI